MKKLTYAALVVISLLIHSVLFAQAGNLTLDQAHELARLSLTLPARNFVGMKFEVETALRPGPFYWFSVTARVPADVSPLLGSFAVNSVTGDVWDPVVCKKLVNKEISDLQRELRRKAHISRNAYNHAAQTAPCEP